ncbi:(Na+)-NQR maturation NqrM [bacterium]|nr:(Na+)-NQR maturation NqrM [bacterium]
MTSRLRSLCLALLCATLLLSKLSTTAGAAEQFALDGHTMGTTYHIVVTGSTEALPTGRTPQTVQREIEAALQQIDQQMSTWRDDSELARFNASRSSDWFAVSRPVAVVVAEALRIAELSDGAFDPTVGPLVRLWSFGSTPRERKLPDQQEIEAALSHLGWRKVDVRHDPPALRKSDPLIELDLSAIAKGYGVDVVSDRLVELGLPHHLVEIGGEVRARGRKSDGSAWRAGIQRPDSDLGVLTAAIELTNRSLATSGDYRNYFEAAGQRYSHTIDPQTGRPIEHNVASVSIVADSCMVADALATAINVLGPDRGLPLAAELHAESLLLLRTADGFQERRSQNFPAEIGASPPQPEPESSPLLRTMLAAGVLIGLAIAGMAVGVIFSNRRIQGSCGGLANMPGAEHSPCELCTKPAEECPNKAAQVAASSASPPSEPLADPED